MAALLTGYAPIVPFLCLVLVICSVVLRCFFFNDTATTEIYTLSLHDALPISHCHKGEVGLAHQGDLAPGHLRSEEHTSELQSRQYLVCRLLLEKKNTREIFEVLSMRSAPMLDLDPALVLVLSSIMINALLALC